METPPFTDSPLAEENTTTKHNRSMDTEIRFVDRRVELPPNFSWTRPLYRPHGKWAWTEGKDILSADPGTRLGSGLEGTVNLKVGYIDDTEITYISKLTSVWDSWKLFLPQLYLNATSKYLRPLQGDCIPWIIGVSHCNGGCIGLALDLPHPSGWREADMFMEEHQKDAVIAAYQKLHNRGILHGDVEYRHILIGDDGKVTIIDFGFTRILDSDERAQKAGVDICSTWELEDEMRKVKFMLDWKDARATEYRLASLRRDREEKDHKAIYAALKQLPPFKTPNIPPEPMLEEEKAAPPSGALNLRDLDEWAYGETWTARRYEVERLVRHVKIRKTDVPRPPIPEKVKTENIVPVSAAAVTATPTPDTVAAPAEVVHGLNEQLSLSTLLRHGPRAPDPEKPTPDFPIVSPKDDLPLESATFHKRSREQQESDPGSENTRGEEKYDEPARKRRRSVEHPNPYPNLERKSLESPSTIPCPGLSTDTTGAAPRPTSPSAAVTLHDSPGFEQTPADVDLTLLPQVSSSNNQIVPCLPSTSGEEMAARAVPRSLAREFISDPTPYELGPVSRAPLKREALGGWTSITPRLEHLYDQPMEQKSEVERRRSDALRRVLMLPPEQRTAIWAEMGQPDVRRLLGLFPDSPAQHDTVSESEAGRRKPATKPRRACPIPRLKVHPRLTAIIQSEGRRPSPSTHKTAPSSRVSNLTTSTNGLSCTEEIEDVPSDIKAKLEELERYREVVMQRAFLEEKDRALMVPIPPSQSACSSSNVVPQRDAVPPHKFRPSIISESSRTTVPPSDLVAGGSSISADPFNLHTLVQKFVTGRMAGDTVESGSGPTARLARVSGPSPGEGEGGKAAPMAPMLRFAGSTKRKRGEEDDSNVNAKKRRAGSCRVM